MKQKTGLKIGLHVCSDKKTELTLGLMFVEMGRRNSWKRRGGRTLFKIFYVLFI